MFAFSDIDFYIFHLISFTGHFFFLLFFFLFKFFLHLNLYALIGHFGRVSCWTTKSSVGALVWEREREIEIERERVRQVEHILLQVQMWTESSQTNLMQVGYCLTLGLYPSSKTGILTNVGFLAVTLHFSAKEISTHFNLRTG